ncbi:hypothetical protein N7509_001953 [Penicillium cosmopolitanum]|uniref:DUF3824 domain-containing protein n=1 Tax=Penicillium cosmopolitanum TaxID=1131564 RepID=A0A9W9W8G7_9EURO|nr:uncharacterized protein N7509_001953 [Penicillium cosmopolitanum]KAJ5408070.1 hypothetical protein N7509_001953 [Penicillium cosmopolitanum]
MSYRDDYRDDRRDGADGRNRGYAADYYDEHPDSRRYDAQRDYGSRQARRPQHEFRRRASPSRSSRDQNRRQSTGQASRVNGDQDRHSTRDEGPSDSDRDKGHSSFLGEKGRQLLMHAALPLVAAGAAEALRARKEPGEWKGDKGKHVLTAAVTNGLVNKDPSKPQKHHIMDTTLHGLREGAPNREERAELQRRVGGSRTSSNLKKVAVAGVVAFAGKELYDRYGRSRSVARDYSDDPYSSKKRSQSVSDDRHRGMKSPDYEESDDQRSTRYKDRNGQSNQWESYPSRDRDYRNWDYGSDGYSDSDMENNYHGDDYGRQQSSRDLARPRSLNRYPDNHPHGDWSSSEGDSDLELAQMKRKMEKKMDRDVLLTSGLATAATVHAAHKVYGSVNKRKQRAAQLEDGEITADEARKERIKANTIDAASIGLAALGIKGAYGEWKEANDNRKETQNFKHERYRHGEQRELERNRNRRYS